MISRSGGRMVSDREVATALRDLIDADPEHGMVLLTADRRVLYSNVAARGYLRDGTPRSEEALLPESLDRDPAGLHRPGAGTSAGRRPPSSTTRATRTARFASPSRRCAARRDCSSCCACTRPCRGQSRPCAASSRASDSPCARRRSLPASPAGTRTARSPGQLGIVEKTVKNVLMSVFTKCNVRNRVQLALRAYDAPVPPVDSPARL